MLVYLTRPVKGYANREGEVVDLPEALAMKLVTAGGALPYQQEDKKEAKPADIQKKQTQKTVKKK